MREWPVKLDQYGIDQELYHELKHFCRQYRAKRAELDDARNPMGTQTMDGMPGAARIGDPTSNTAIHVLQTPRLVRIARDVEAIEQAALEADGNLYQWIIKSVTTKQSLDLLAAPCGRRQFFDARRRFFWHLANRLEKIG